MAVLLILALLLPALAGAENLGPGGGTRIIAGDELVGPYRVLFTASPEPATVGQVTFVVRLSDPGSNAKLLDAEIIVELVNGETGVRLAQPATHANAGNALDYAAHFQIAQPGQWDGLLRAHDTAGTAELRFTQRILPARQLSTLIVIGLPFLVVLAALGGLWFARSGSRQSSATI